MAKAPTVQQFFQRFPTDDACLDHLMKVRYGESLDCPKCGKHGKFHRLHKRPVYSCQWCGHQISPMEGTPFERSRTPLQKWFYAMYLFTTSRHGVPAKELQRQLGVTYKTAWRMGHELRKHMAIVDGDPPLGGHVEIDETLVGGRNKLGTGKGPLNKTMVFGMVERDGDVMTRIVSGASNKILYPHVLANIERGSTISSDEWRGYVSIARLGYPHGTVNHAMKEYARGKVHTNTIEGFWSMLKRSIRGTHIHVSRRHLSKYLGEFEFRWNSRHAPEMMFARLLMSF